MIAENNSCFGVLNKLKFSITSVCPWPIYLDILQSSFKKVCFCVPLDYFLISSICLLKFLPVFSIFNVMRAILFKQFQSMSHSGAFITSSKDSSL